MPASTSQTVIKRVFITIILITLVSAVVVYSVQRSKKQVAILENAESGLARLMEGNARFVKNEMLHPDESKERRVVLSNTQNPFAIVISCSDSRVPPELIFDQGLGDLFVIRTAGNLVDSIELGSIEYAVEHLDVKFIIVLGHENCGVIEAFIEKGTEHNHLDKLLEEVSNEPEVIEAIKAGGNKTDNCVRANIKHITKLLRNSGPVLAEKYQTGELKIVGARYDLDKGTVEVVE